MAKVIIIEDNEILNNSLQYFYKRKGWEVVGHTDPNKALNELSKQSYDLVLTDYMLQPHQDGVSFLKELKKLDNPKQKVILTSYIYDNEVIKQARENGMQAFIYKPLDLNVLINMSNALIHKS